MGWLRWAGNASGLRRLSAQRSRALSVLVAALTAALLFANSAFAGSRFTCCTMTGVRSLHACCPASVEEPAASPPASELTSSACCVARAAERLPSGQAMSAPLVASAPFAAEVPFLAHPQQAFDLHGGLSRARSGSDPPTAAEKRLRIMVFLT